MANQMTPASGALRGYRKVNLASLTAAEHAWEQMVAKTDDRHSCNQIYNRCFAIPKIEGSGIILVQLPYRPRHVTRHDMTC